MMPETIDVERLRSMCGGNAALAVELIGDLIADGEPLLAQIDAHAAKRARSELLDAAHALKGIAANIGAARLRAAAAELEQIAGPESGNDWDAVTRAIDVTRGELAAVRTAHGGWVAAPDVAGRVFGRPA
jgi:HPt (histidine-containing phosphotransfer) domain-containing protein